MLNTSFFEKFGWTSTDINYWRNVSELYAGRVFVSDLPKHMQGISVKTFNSQLQIGMNESQHYHKFQIQPVQLTNQFQGQIQPMQGMNQFQGNIQQHQQQPIQGMNYFQGQHQQYHGINQIQQPMQGINQIQGQIQNHSIQQNNEFQQHHQQQQEQLNKPNKLATMPLNVISPYLKSVSPEDPEDAKLVSPFMQSLMNTSSSNNNNVILPSQQEPSKTSSSNMGLAAIPFPNFLSSPFNNSVAPAPLDDLTPVSNDSVPVVPRTITTIIPPNALPGQKLKLISPTGDTIEVIIPPGLSSGQSITVGY